MAGYELFCSLLIVHLAASTPPTTPSAGCRHPFSNEIIPASSFPMLIDNMVCHCIVSPEDTPGDNYPFADCHFHGPAATTPDLRPQCTNSDGHTYYVGTVYSPNACVACECTLDDGERCHTICPPTPCVNPMPVDCCLMCLNGPDCLDTRDSTWIASGTSITKASGEVCQCPQPTPDEVETLDPRTPICTVTP